MRYVMSDIHGEYELFLALLDKIGFSDKDELYVCGDVIEKGCSSVRLLKKLAGMPNAHLILGNHEYELIKLYNCLMQDNGGDYELVLERLREHIEGDGEMLEWEDVDFIESLPSYIETDDFICVHAGVVLKDGTVPPIVDVEIEELMYDRSFKEPDVIPKRSKCVFFGHTATTAICDEARILAYKRPECNTGTIGDYAKVHLDTCTFVSGTLGCFSVDECKAYYVERSELK